MSLAKAHPEYHDIIMPVTCSYMTLTSYNTYHRYEQQEELQDGKDQTHQQRTGSFEASRPLFQPGRKSLESRVANLEQHHYSTNVPPFYFTLQNFAHYKKHGLKWQTSAFYSHPFGYKMCIEVTAGGEGVGQGTHVSLMVYILQGEHDDGSSWPFRGNVTVWLLNERRRDGGHFEVCVEFTDASLVNSGRVEMEERSAGWGLPLFISHSRLQYDPVANTEYLKYDRLRFVVTSAEGHVQ